MIYAQRKKDPTTRVVGGIMVVVVMFLVYILLQNMIQKKEVVYTPPVQVEIQEQKEEIKEEEVKLEVEPVEIQQQEVQIEMPDIVFDAPAPPNIPPMKPVERPAEPPKPAPVAPPAPVAKVYVIRPKPDQRRFQEMLADNYPPALIRAKKGGDVGVSFCIDTNGRISDVKITTSSGEDSLDQATLRNIGRVRFDPAKDSTGKPVAICNPPYEMTVAWRPPER